MEIIMGPSITDTLCYMKAIFVCYSSVILWLLFTIGLSLLILQILVGHVLLGRYKKVR